MSNNKRNERLSLVPTVGRGINNATPDSKRGIGILYEAGFPAFFDKKMNVIKHI